jgi:predicted nucleic acid-binding protein
VFGAKVVEPKKKLALCRDPEDDMLLECCKAAHADILITGDKDLLNLDSIPFRLTIMNVSIRATHLGHGRREAVGCDRLRQSSLFFDM